MNSLENKIQSRYDELMQEGKHGHYESMFQVFREMTSGREEEMGLERLITITVQDAFKQGLTTINEVSGWMLKQILPVMEKEFNREIKDLHTRINILQDQELVRVFDELELRIKDLENGKDGGLSKPKGRTVSKSTGNVQ
jgi:hypothetical protein